MINIWEKIKLAFNRKPLAPIVKAEEVKVEQPIPAKKPRRPRKKKDA